MCSLATSDENEVDGNVGIARRGDQLALSLAKRQGNGEGERRELLETWMASAALAATTHTPKGTKLEFSASFHVICTGEEDDIRVSAESRPTDRPTPLSLTLSPSPFFYPSRGLEMRRGGSAWKS